MTIQLFCKVMLLLGLTVIVLDIITNVVSVDFFLLPFSLFLFVIFFFFKFKFLIFYYFFLC